MKTILVVEDDFILASEYAIILEGAGWQVVGPAATVNQAMDLLRDNQPTAALLDLHLRRDLATPVAETLLERGIPFLAVSAAENLVELGGEAFRGIRNLGKPIQPTELVHAVNGITDPKI